jgi:hypothetical protein
LASVRRPATSTVLVFFAAAVAGAAASPGAYTLYTCMVTSKDYVVGAKLPPSGIFIKPSGGAWKHAGYNHPFIAAVDYDPRDPRVVYVAAGNGLLRVSDRGEHWKILTGNDVTELMDVAVDRTNRAISISLTPGESGSATTAASHGSMPRRVCTGNIRRRFASIHGGAAA